MRYFLDEWPKILPRIRENYLLIFADFDGTLTPIVETPERAVLTTEQKKILRQLAALRDVKVVVVSGRQLADVKRKVGSRKICYIGNHGLEISGPSITHRYPESAHFRKMMTGMTRSFRKQLAGIPGVRVEDKKLTVSIHYRQVKEADVRRAKEIVYRVAAPALTSLSAILRYGKKVWEVRPKTHWDKGSSALWMLGRVMAQASQEITLFYFGDDDTDEDAFRALGKKGYTVRVTDRPAAATAAHYFVSSPAEVHVFLKQLINLRKTRQTQEVERV